MTKLSVDVFIVEAKRLRAQADAAEAVFLRFLYDGEEAGVHDGTGESFVEFIAKHNLCRPERYAKFKRTFQAVGAAEISDVGIEAVLAAADVSDSQRLDYIAEARAWEATNGTTMSEESARRGVRDRRIVVAARATKHRGFLDLVEQNKRLLEENARLKAENSALKVEVKLLKRSQKSKKRARAA